MTTRVPYQLLNPDAQTALTAFRNKLISGDLMIVMLHEIVLPGWSGIDVTVDKLDNNRLCLNEI